MNGEDTKEAIDDQPLNSQQHSSVSSMERTKRKKGRWLWKINSIGMNLPPLQCCFFFSFLLLLFWRGRLWVYICGEESNSLFFQLVVERGTRGNKGLRLSFALRGRESERETRRRNEGGVCLVYL